MQKFKDLFYDDLSVARGNYFLTLLSAFFITNYSTNWLRCQ